MTSEEQQTLMNQIREDPRLMILSQAIVDLSTLITQTNSVVMSLAAQLDATSNAVKTMNATMEVITSQMWMLSQKPGFPLAFRGVHVK